MGRGAMGLAAVLPCALAMGCGLGHSDGIEATEGGGGNTGTEEDAGSCPGGCVATLAAGGYGYAIALDKTSVYWVDSDSDAVMRVPIDGGTPVTLASNQESLFGVAVDDVNVYWTAGSNVMRVPIGGGTPAVVASPGAQCEGIAVNATSLCWIAGDAMCMPIGGGTPITVGPASAARYITVDATNAYWTGEDGYVRKAPVVGGEVTVIASGQEDPLAVVVDATSVYWTTIAPNAVMKAPLDGGTATVLAAGTGTYGLAVDSTSVYWSDLKAMAVASVPIGGGTPKTLASTTEAIQGMAVDATSLYWVGGPGGVEKLTPK